MARLRNQYVDEGSARYRCGRRTGSRRSSRHQPHKLRTQRATSIGAPRARRPIVSSTRNAATILKPIPLAAFVIAGILVFFAPPIAAQFITTATNETQQIFAPDDFRLPEEPPFANFATSVSLDGDTMVATLGRTRSAIVYTRAANTWAAQQLSSSPTTSVRDPTPT